MSENWKKILLFAIVLLIAVLLFNFTRSVKVEDISDKLPKHATRKYSQRTLSQIEQIVFHHSGEREDQTALQIAQYHVSPANHICVSGCPGIAYHFVIDRSGKAYQTQSLKTISYHIANQNTKSVGVCFIGNYDLLEPTSEQLKAAKSIIRLINRKVGKNLRVTNHKDACGGCTTCPGKNLDKPENFKI